MTTDTPRDTHTPGPWQSRRRHATAPIEIVAPDGQEVAITSARHPLDADDANARLIAAAPALLAAAEAVQLDLGDIEDGRGALRYRPSMVALHAAIDAATGTT